MKRGLLYWINLEPSSPPEFGKIRPGLIVSNSDQNLRLPTVVIIPVSSRAPEIWPLRIRFQVPHGKDSYLVIPGIRQVNKLRLQEIISPV
ncbi:MAG: type II toxin-antitoxin system PemK/MazF family toxin, partial [Deltaproteobacteria bacterium]|nr:type II toxin-antitoxin system PemK/MazF family toxin [Deltaproteobacteria bacterium]